MKNSIRKLVLAMSIGILAAGSTLYAQPQNDGLDDTYDTSIEAQDAEVPDLPDVTADTIEAEIRHPVFMRTASVMRPLT